MSTEIHAKEDVWEREYFTGEYDNPFIFYVIFGIEDPKLELSRSKHNVDELPKELEIRLYSSENSQEEKEYLEGFLNGTFGMLLKQDSPALFNETLKTKTAAVLMGQYPDTNSLNYLKNTIGTVRALIENPAVSVLDVQTLRFLPPQEWADVYFEPKKPQPHEHVLVIASYEQDGLWLHTRGMRTFGRPDISLVGWPEGESASGEELINRLIEMFAYGAPPEIDKEIRIEGLPSGMKKELKGGYDDLDFNNYFIEIKWPK